ncbi:MAG: DUF2147 domain-containing protein [Ferruginibacter sp.]
MKTIVLTILLFSICSFNAAVNINADAIVGKWMSLENNLEVEVFRSGREYKAKVVWFDDSDDKSQPMHLRRDTKNPNKALRSRKIIGMEIMHGLIFNAGDEEWQDGTIYDSRTGKNWNVKAWINKTGKLKVRGYWHFEIFGKTRSLKRV